MKLAKENTFRQLLAVCILGIMLLASSWMWADDTIPVTYEPTYTCDTLFCGDSIIVIHTVCAPICSSRACVFNKEWQEIGILRAPFNSIFPEAYIQDGKILWRDNDNFDYSPVL